MRRGRTQGRLAGAAWMLRRGAAVVLAVVCGCSSDRGRDEVSRSTTTTRDTLAPPPRRNGALEADAVQDTVRFYLAKLGDRTFWTPYGEAEEPQRWYLASERLGEIGGPAIPGLIGRLDDPDDFVVMQALYAVMLASQDSAITRRTGGEYVRYEATVLDSATNEANLPVARAWWQRHRGLWGPAAGGLP